jgi:hypothetical protein
MEVFMKHLTLCWYLNCGDEHGILWRDLDAWQDDLDARQYRVSTGGSKHIDTPKSHWKQWRRRDRRAMKRHVEASMELHDAGLEVQHRKYLKQIHEKFRLQCGVKNIGPPRHSDRRTMKMDTTSPLKRHGERRIEEHTLQDTTNPLKPVECNLDAERRFTRLALWKMRCHFRPVETSGPVAIKKRLPELVGAKRTSGWNKHLRCVLYFLLSLPYYFIW